MTVESQIADDHLFVCIDTNVLLYFTGLTDVDWCKELNARAVPLVFTPVVLDEFERQQRLEALASQSWAEEG
jgi:hypothetical protein